MPDNYFASYLPLLLHFMIAFAVAGAIVTLSWLIGQRKPTRAKMSPYECGVAPVGDARQRFSVKFYLVGMLWNRPSSFLFTLWLIPKSLQFVYWSELQGTRWCKISILSGQSFPNRFFYPPSE